MNKELPKMYHNKLNKPIVNIQKVYSSFSESKDIKYPNVSIDKKIKDIFNSNDYVYKADVTIVTDSDILHRKVVTRNNNYLITIDNEFIPINTIRDIYK